MVVADVRAQVGEIHAPVAHRRSQERTAPGGSKSIEERGGGGMEWTKGADADAYRDLDASNMDNKAIRTHGPLYSSSIKVLNSV
jgi:hypothetical protein